MVFETLVKEAKKNTPEKVFRKEGEIKNLIDCTGAHPVHVNSASKCTWDSCKYLKKTGPQNFCTEYMCYCMQDKCNKPIR